MATNFNEAERKKSEKLVVFFMNHYTRPDYRPTGG